MTLFQASNRKAIKKKKKGGYTIQWHTIEIEVSVIVSLANHWKLKSLLSKNGKITLDLTTGMRISTHRTLTDLC